MITHVSKEGVDWIPNVTPTSPVDPQFFYGCRNVLELRDYYRDQQRRRFVVSDVIAATVGANEGFSDFPVVDNEWPKVQLALLLLAADDGDLKILQGRGLFSKNRGSG